MINNIYGELPLPVLVHVMALQSRAEELGFKWNKEKYFTPAWKVGEYPFLKKARFGINQDIWNREIMLWAADCVEHVLPFWENWARNANTTIMSSPRDVINKTRDYANGICGITEIKNYVEKNRNMVLGCKYGTPSPLNRIGRASCLIYDFPLVAASNVYTINTPDNSLPEVEWQRMALANRIDKVAPWSTNE